MLINKERDKLINAIIYFVKNTKNCGKMKLFKLLYFLDMDHYKLTGKSVTGLKYYAWKMGPVPNSLFEEIEKPRDDFRKSVAVIPQSFFDPDFKVEGQSKAITFNPKVPFNEKIFSPREMKIFKRLVEIYKDVTAKDISEISHSKGDPWDRVFNSEKRKQAEIPYVYSLDSSDAKIDVERAEDVQEHIKLAKALFGN